MLVNVSKKCPEKPIIQLTVFSSKEEKYQAGCLRVDLWESWDMVTYPIYVIYSCIHEHRNSYMVNFRQKLPEKIPKFFMCSVLWGRALDSFCGDKNSVDIKVSQSYGKRMLWQKSVMGTSDGEQVRFRNLSRHQVER